MDADDILIRCDAIDTPEQCAETARNLVNAATESGRGFDAATRLEILFANGVYRMACLHEANGLKDTRQEIAVMPWKSGTEFVANAILSEAAFRSLEVVGMARDGEIPDDVASFSYLHAHFEANDLGFGGCRE